MENKIIPITREKAVMLLRKYPQTESDQVHYLETEAIMRALAEKLGEDADYWAMLGLLHDVDWALTKENIGDHCLKAEEILKEQGFDEEFIQIVQSHAYNYEQIPVFKDKSRTKKIEYALAASETLTGLIHAYALMKKRNISEMSVSGLKKKFQSKKFAENCNRDIIMEIEKILPLDEFFQIAINAVKSIKDNIGLN